MSNINIVFLFFIVQASHKGRESANSISNVANNPDSKHPKRLFISTEIHDSKYYLKFPNTQLWFNETTLFEAWSGMVIRLKPPYKVILVNDSRLILNNGSTPIMGKKSRIIVKQGAAKMR